MQRDLNDPTVYRGAYEHLKSLGYSHSEIESELGGRVSMQQAPGAVESGLKTREEAFEAVGGLSTPGSVDLFGAAGEQEAQPTEAQAFERQTAKVAVSELERLYGRGSAKNIGTKKDLSLSETSTAGGKLGGKLIAAKNKYFDSAFMEDLNSYKAMIDMSKGIFTQAFGSGTPQQQEAIDFLKNAPNETSTGAEAENWFSSVRVFLGEAMEAEPPGLDTGQAPTQRGGDNLKAIEGMATYGEQPETIPDEIGGTLPDYGIVSEVQAAGGEIMPEEPGELAEPPEIPGARGVAVKVAQAAPIAFGIAGGVGGAIVGLPFLGLGSIAGSAVGTGIGTAAGVAVRNMVEDLAGVQDETSLEQLQSAGVEASTAAVLDLATAGLWKAGGAVAGKTIKPLVTKGTTAVEKYLALRAIRPSPSQQRKFLAKTGVELKDFAIEKGLYKKGVEQVDAMIQPLQTKFDDIVIKNEFQMSKQAIVQKFDDAIKLYNEMPFDKAHKLAKNIEKNKEAFIKTYKGVDEVSSKVLTTARKELDNLIPSGAFANDPIAAGADYITRSVYQESMQETSTAMGVPGLKKYGQELNKLYNFQNIAAAQQFLGEGTLPAGLLKTIGVAGGGGVGLAIGGWQGMILGLMVPSIANHPRTIAIVINGMRKANIVAETLPANQQAKFLNEAFRRILTNVGAHYISTMGEEEEGMGETPPELEGIPVFE